MDGWLALCYVDKRWSLARWLSRRCPQKDRLQIDRSFLQRSKQEIDLWDPIVLFLSRFSTHDMGKKIICSYITDTIWYSASGMGEVASRLCVSYVVKSLGNKRPNSMLWVLRSIGLNTWQPGHDPIEPEHLRSMGQKINNWNFFKGLIYNYFVIIIFVSYGKELPY